MKYAKPKSDKLNKKALFQERMKKLAKSKAAQKVARKQMA
jgi:hypothetical protein